MWFLRPLCLKHIFVTFYLGFLCLWPISFPKWNSVSLCCQLLNALIVQSNGTKKRLFRMFTFVCSCQRVLLFSPKRSKHLPFKHKNIILHTKPHFKLIYWFRHLFKFGFFLLFCLVSALWIFMSERIFAYINNYFWFASSYSKIFICWTSKYSVCERVNLVCSDISSKHKQSSIIVHIFLSS